MNKDFKKRTTKKKVNSYVSVSHVMAKDFGKQLTTQNIKEIVISFNKLLQNVVTKTLSVVVVC